MQFPFLEDILSLADFSFGKNYLTKDQLKNYMTHPLSNVIIESRGDDLIGFSIVQILSVDQLKKELFVDELWVEEQFAHFNSVGYRKMTAIDETHKNTGVASRLFSKGSAWFTDKTDIITSVVWTKNGEPSFSPILEKNNFQVIKTIKQYWKTDSLEKNYSCPICKAPPCHCDASIYMKRITEQGSLGKAEEMVFPKPPKPS